MNLPTQITSTQATATQATFAQATSRRNHRSDKEWVVALRGTLGTEAQHDALEDLARYQQVVAYNYLIRCEGLSVTLQTFNREEIAALAEDHAYTFIEKLVKDDFALLDKYSETGHFTSWAAQVLRNAMISEMRKSSWRKQVPLTESVASKSVERRNRQPEELAMQGSITAIVQDGLESLPERYRIVLTRCLLNGDSAQSVAEDFETTQNAVNVLVYRAKRKMRTYLTAQGLDATAVNHFV